MDKSKLPANWDDLWALCQKMTQKDSSGKISRIGFNWTWNDIWTMHQFSPILAQVKGSILSDDGKTVTLDSPEGLRALEIYGGAYKLGAASKAFNVPQAFENAKQGVLISGPFEPATVLSVNSKLEYSKDFVNGRFPQVPGDEPVAYIWGPTSLTPNPKSKVTSQLYAVIKFMWDRPQVFWNVANLLVTRKILLQSEDLKKAPWIPTFLEDYKIARPAVKSYIYAEIQTALFQMAQAVVVENKDAKSALRQAAADISKALASQ